MESILDFAAILDLTGRFLHLNSVGRRWLECEGDWSPDQRTFAELFANDAREFAHHAVSAVCEGDSGQFIGCVQPPAGLLKWWDVAVSPIRAGDGAVSQALVIARDITKQKRKDEFISLEREMLETITGGRPLDDVLENLVLLIEQYSRDTICCVLLLGEDGKAVHHSSAPNFSPEYIRAVQGLVVGPRAGSCGTAMYRGARVIVEDIFTDPLWDGFDDIKKLSGGRACWSTPIFSTDNKVVGSFAIYARQPRQPTSDELELMDSAAQFVRVAIDKHRAQRALRQSEARNRAMLRAIPDWVFLTSLSGELLSYHVSNPATLPVNLANRRGTKLGEIIPDPMGAELGRAIEGVAKRGEPHDLKTTLRLAGELRYYEMSIVSCDGDKVLSVVRDVTVRKRAELEASTQRGQLAHLGRVALLAEITGALAHELSQPLATMRTHTDIAQKLLAAPTPALDLLAETLGDISDSNRRAVEVIDRLRALLKKENVHFQQVNLDDVVRDTLTLSRYEIITRGVSVEHSCLGKGASVWGDRVQLQQVVLNLILNACDAMTEIPESERRLEISTECNGTFAELRVCDTGTGILANDLERVFQPFVSYGKQGQGLGVGLAISRSILDAHHGTICAENNTDRGATFRCRFPCVDAQVCPLVRAQVRLAPPTAEPSE